MKVAPAITCCGARDQNGLALQVMAMLSAVPVAEWDDGLLDACLTRLAAMLQDDCHAARLVAATAIPPLYSKWQDAQVSFVMFAAAKMLHL